MLQQPQIRAAVVIAIARITVPMSELGIRGAGGSGNHRRQQTPAIALPAPMAFSFWALL